MSIHCGGRPAATEHLPPALVGHTPGARLSLEGDTMNCVRKCKARNADYRGPDHCQSAEECGRRVGAARAEVAGGCLCWQCLDAIGLSVAEVAGRWAALGEQVPTAGACDSCGEEGYALAVPSAVVSQ